MATTRLKEFVGELRFLGESVMLRRTDDKRLNCQFLLIQFGMDDELTAVRRHFPEDNTELCTWLAELAELVTAGRLQEGPQPLSWTLPGTTLSHGAIAPGGRLIPGPSIWRDVRLL